VDNDEAVRFSKPNKCYYLQRIGRKAEQKIKKIINIVSFHSSKDSFQNSCTLNGIPNFQKIVLESSTTK
jgi:predicted transcriptional regulator